MLVFIDVFVYFSAGEGIGAAQHFFFYYLKQNIFPFCDITVSPWTLDYFLMGSLSYLLEEKKKDSVRNNLPKDLVLRKNA